jgi:phosphoglycolate phosphatase
MSLSPAPRAVFFDLDGTLVDSAPDLIAAVQSLCVELGAPAPDVDAVRRVVSTGGRAMLRKGLPGADDAMIDQWLPRFLDIYSVAMTVHTHLYDGIADVLDRLAARDIAWGIVTNKPGWLARPMLERMGFHRGAVALVTGDCLPVRKPDPAPVRFACEQAGVDPAHAVMIGDDLRDVLSGRDAGARTIAAGWGYLDGGDPHTWGADLVVDEPRALIAALALD